MSSFFDAFPDARYTLDDLFCAADKSVWRGTWHATQDKEWEGIPATGRKAKWTVIIIGRFEADKLAEIGFSSIDTVCLDSSLTRDSKSTLLVISRVGHTSGRLSDGAMASL